MATCMYDQSIITCIRPADTKWEVGQAPYLATTLCHYRYIQGCFRVCEVGTTKVVHCVFKVLNITPYIPTYIWPLPGGSWLLTPLIDLRWRAQPWARVVKVVHWNFEHHRPPFSLIYIWATCWCGCLLTLSKVFFDAKTDDAQRTRV
jgi:hypothetical protein